MEHFILRNLTRRRRHSGCRYFHDAAAAAAVASTAVSSIKWVRDRGLDHAVEKERDLKTVLNLKNLIKSEPSKSLPLSIISDNKESLGIPFRPIDFLRKYSSVFQEFLPGGIGIHPHIKLASETLTLDAEEQLIFQSVNYKQEVADRLLKLLMIARINKIPLCIIDRLKWDLGLPQDYTKTVVPEFPDYFQVTGNGNELELVCWSDELAVAVMEKKSMSSFPLQYSRGFELDKKFKKWVDDWQKLPYVSPYRNALHLQANSDESDKWAVALLHEILHLLVPKKTEKDNLLILGEYLGVRSRFKKALLQHPGIFYVSSKLHTHTVVLREAYKRDLLVGKPQHPLMDMRSKYIHLMNMVKEEDKSKNVRVDGAAKHKASHDAKEGEVEEAKCNESEEEEEEDETLSSLSDSEFECVDDDDSSDDEMEGNNSAVNKGRHTKKMKFDAKFDANSKVKSTRTTKFTQNGSASRNSGNSRKGDRNDNRITNKVSSGTEVGKGRPTRKEKVDEKVHSRINQRSDRRRGMREANPIRILKTELQGAKNPGGRSPGRSGVSTTREGQL